MSFESELQAQCKRLTERVKSLENTLHKADEHTDFLMKKIAGLETNLAAAEYAAKVNYEGWQQECARHGHEMP